MSDAEETLRREIHETKQNAQETWLHVRCSKMMDALGALKVEHAAALSRARADALEEAAKQLDGYASADAKRIRAMKGTPAPATIPVERVRTGAIQADDPPGRGVEHIRTVLLRALAERPGHPVRRAVESIAGDLGVDLDAKGEAPVIPDCDWCKHPAHEHDTQSGWCSHVSRSGEECGCIDGPRASMVTP